jgi:phosphatidate cytidylyltransferase
MHRRILSFILLWCVVLAVAVLFGEIGAVILITLAAFLTQYEIYQLLGRIGPRASERLGCFVGLGIPLGAYFAAPYHVDLAAVFGLGVVVVVVAHLFQPVAKRVFQRIGATVFGLAMAPLLLGFFSLVLRLDHGMSLCVWIIAVAKFADVGGLLTGMAFGRTKLAPNLSPNKTREGAAGGVLWSVAIGAGAVALFPSYFPEALSPFLAGVIAVPVAIAGISSDLFESAVKREAGVKDSGRIIPGIGGAFDLTDSLLLAAPVGYFLIARVIY